MADVQHQDQHALEANKRAKEARDKQAKDAEAEVKEAQAEKESRNAEVMERQNKSKPTPTQEENDLASAGIHTDTHEYDGSPPQGNTPEEAVAAAKHYKQPEDSAYVGAKQMESGKSGQYKTRASRPAHNA
jgi:hypothetical protein